MKPRIGITPSPTQDVLAHGTFERYAMARPYVDAVLAAGGVPIVLPPHDGDAGALLDILDGLLLSGGGDVEPARYGEPTIHPATYGIHPLRDRFEAALLAGAFERDLPTLCICRGIQVLNVTLGGTLVQDIADQLATPVQHRQQEIGLATHDIGHDVDVAADSPLARVFGAARVGVNSYHHQAIMRLAPDLVPVASAPDGVTEAVVLPSKAFVLGVQWHPELMFERHPEQLKPFLALTEAASAQKLATLNR